MKIAVVGGGSTYSPELLHGLADRSERLGVATVALTDIDSKRLEIVGGFVERMCRRIAPALRIERHLDAARALEGARFVVTQIRVGGQAARLEDERLGLVHGVIGQETTGVGGLAKALRTIPALLEIAKKIEATCPNATLINFTNPVSVVTEALLNHTRVQAIGLCNIPISQRMEIAEVLRVPPSEVVLDSVGLNHLSFVRSIKVCGEEVLPQLIKGVTRLLESEHRPRNIPAIDFPAELIESLQMLPSDYLRFYLLTRETIEEQRRTGVLRAEEVMAIERDLLAHYADTSNHERPAALARRGGAHYSHAALEIIESITLDRKDTFVVDVRNGDAVRELPADACVEVPCRIDREGAFPDPQRPLEPAICGLIQHVKCYEQLAIRAAMSRSRRDLYLALVAHPLTPSAALASKIADALVARLGWS